MQDDWRAPITLTVEKEIVPIVNIYDPPTRQELEREPFVTEPAFLPSDGVVLDLDGRSAVHAFGSERQCVLSNNWVHVNHQKKTQSWTVSARTNNGARLYFGISEAASFAHKGRTIGYNCRGGWRLGWWPCASDQVTTHSDDWCSQEDANNINACVITVTVDLKAQRLKVSFYDVLKDATNTFENLLDRWEHARLWGSFTNRGEVVEFL
jgi:hypothetical protein